jgi:hypothetical protein
VRHLDRFAPFITILLLSIVVAVLYAPGLRGAYYGDDLMFVRPLNGDLLRPFVHANPETGWYRPIEAVLLGSIQDRFGLDPRPIHALALLLHVVVALLVSRLALRLKLGRDAAIASAFAFAITQACASAVLGNDTLSHLLATAFGMGAVLLFAAPPATSGSGPRLVLGAAFVLLAMLAKEAGIGWAAAAALAAVAAARAHDGRLNRAVLPVALIALTAAGYLLLRDTVGARPAAIGPGRYDLDPGPGVFVRLAMLLGVSVLPVSTVTVAEAWARGSRVILAVVAVIELAIVAGLAAGLIRRPKLAVLLLLAAALALGPAIAIRHVSELYAYTAMPFVAVGVGALAASALRSSHGVRRWGVIGAIAAIALLHGFAVRQKAALAAANGERARVLLAALEPVVAGVPSGGSVLLVQSHGLPPGYSVYRQVGFEPVEFAESFLQSRSGRSDVQVRVVTPSEARAQVGQPGMRAFTLMGDDLVRFDPAR